MVNVFLIDSGICNIDSIARALSHIGATPEIITDPDKLKGDGPIILPGVGAPIPAMKKLGASGFTKSIQEAVKSGVPFLGICLGMQLLATRSFEGPETACLGLVSGDVVPLKPQSDDERIPHIGWNSVDQAPGAALFDGITPGTDFYFLHSYHFVCEPSVVQASTPYCGQFVSSIRQGNIFGVQFHPEKSHRGGLDLLRNFLRQR